MRTSDSPSLRKHRGAFFTPPAIAAFLADWAVVDDSAARVMDPTCGEAVFLIAAAEKLRSLGAGPAAIAKQVSGFDVHRGSLKGARDLLAGRDGCRSGCAEASSRAPACPGGLI
ncbi:MAG TPA: N-6 DNA methylase [Solirubrobacteraceae bacterium]|nr:N-6 DNA methylase [Solirubrobacteraceae bacterium]